MAVTLLYDYWRSSASYRLRIALALIGEAYTSITVNLLEGEQRSPENLARNPQGLVPTLEIDGLIFTQSLAILEYLDETRQAGFLPASPVGKARVRALAYAIAMEIHPVCNLHVARYAVSASDGSISTEGWMQHFIAHGLEAVERMLDQNDRGHYCHGDTVTLADICLVPQIYNARRWGVDMEPFSNIRTVVDRLESLPAFEVAQPDRWKP
ncbi:maleylacetoacetate isomerase [Ochrobactrum sp. Q0168]|uniref:maleylacetoacetate isomerase n=1 Tax=Ochrobactrum sp. Q0168 TaxID=2793241 RepID=UPI0018EB1020|nr:maleylacetoacetate isomerase [Ochrobactrum sp. Q0168]